jgi:signal recognition particle GTPase
VSTDTPRPANTLSAAILLFGFEMFESLSTKLGNVFGRLRGKGSLSENDVMSVAREIRVALLEADVALPVVKDFIESIKKKAVGPGCHQGRQSRSADC